MTKRNIGEGGECLSLSPGTGNVSMRHKRKAPVCGEQNNNGTQTSKSDMHYSTIKTNIEANDVRTLDRYTRRPGVSRGTTQTKLDSRTAVRHSVNCAVTITKRSQTPLVSQNVRIPTSRTFDAGSPTKNTRCCERRVPQPSASSSHRAQGARHSDLRRAFLGYLAVELRTCERWRPWLPLGPVTSVGVIGKGRQVCGCTCP